MKLIKEEINLFVCYLALSLSVSLNWLQKLPRVLTSVLPSKRYSISGNRYRIPIYHSILQKDLAFLCFRQFSSKKCWITSRENKLCEKTNNFSKPVSHSAIMKNKRTNLDEFSKSWNSSSAHNPFHQLTSILEEPNKQLFTIKLLVFTYQLLSFQIWLLIDAILFFAAIFQCQKMSPNSLQSFEIAE